MCNFTDSISLCGSAFDKSMCYWRVGCKKGNAFNTHTRTYTYTYNDKYIPVIGLVMHIISDIKRVESSVRQISKR